MLLTPALYLHSDVAKPRSVSFSADPKVPAWEQSSVHIARGCEKLLQTQPLDSRTSPRLAFGSISFPPEFLSQFLPILFTSVFAGIQEVEDRRGAGDGVYVS